MLIYIFLKFQLLWISERWLLSSSSPIIGLTFETNAASEAHRVDEAARSRDDSSQSGLLENEHLEYEAVDVSDDEAKQLTEPGGACLRTRKILSLKDAGY